MKVAILFDGLTVPPKDGVTYRAFFLAKHLYQQGHDVVLFLGDRGWTTDEQLLKLKIPIVVFPADWLYDQRLSKVADLMKREKISLLHIANSHPVFFTFGKQLSIWANTKIVIDMHDVDYHLLRSLGKIGRVIREAKFFQTLIGNLADGIIVISPFDQDQLLQLGIRKSYMSCIPHGVELFETSRDPAKLRDFVFLGNMYYEPNLRAAKFLIERVWPTVAKLRPELRLNFVGRTPKSLTKLATRSVFFLREQDNLKDVFKWTIAGLAPIFQGSGLKVKPLTYAGYGLPVVATPIAIAGYSQKKNFFIAHNSNEFSNIMMDLALHPNQAITQGRRLQNDMKKSYSWEKAAEATWKMYKKVFIQKRNNNIVRPKKVDGEPKALWVKDAPYPMWLREKRYSFGGANYPRKARKIFKKIIWL